MTQDSLINCPHCGKESHDGDIYCSVCGTKISSFENTKEIDFYVSERVREELKRQTGDQNLVSLSVAKTAEESLIKSLKWYVVTPFASVAVMLVILGISNYAGIQERFNSINSRLVASDKTAKDALVVSNEARKTAGFTRDKINNLNHDLEAQSAEIHSRGLALDTSFKTLEEAQRIAAQKAQTELQKAQITYSQIENVNHSLVTALPMILRKADDSELTRRYPSLGQSTHVTYDGQPWSTTNPKPNGEKWLSLQISPFGWGRFNHDTVLNFISDLKEQHIVTLLGTFGTGWPKPATLGGAYAGGQGISLLYFRPENSDLAKSLATKISNMSGVNLKPIFEDITKLQSGDPERMIVEQTGVDLFLNIAG